MGDDNNYSYLSTPDEDTLSDMVALNVLKTSGRKFKLFDFMYRGSDERQYCSPNVELPVGALMRTKYGDYPEYHTSLDDLSVISPAGLQGAFDMVMKIIETLEFNKVYKCITSCEPFLSKYDLYSMGKSHLSNGEDRNSLHLLAYSNSRRSLIEISNIMKEPVPYLHELALMLLKKGLLEEVVGGGKIDNW